MLALLGFMSEPRVAQEKSAMSTPAQHVQFQHAQASTRGGRHHVPSPAGRIGHGDGMC